MQTDDLETCLTQAFAPPPEQTNVPSSTVAFTRQMFQTRGSGQPSEHEKHWTCPCSPVGLTLTPPIIPTLTPPLGIFEASSLASGPQHTCHQLHM